MARSARTVGLIALTAAVTAVLVSLVIPGCTQNQENSPISVSNSQGRLVLSVACNTDGSLAYVTDGRNVYRYNTSGQPQPWQCILSQSERLEMAVQHDPARSHSPPPVDRTDVLRLCHRELERRAADRLNACR